MFSSNQDEEPHLAWLLRIGIIKVEGLQMIFAIPAQCHRSIWLAFADWFHYGDFFLGRVNPENRWLALALGQCWVHPQHDFDLYIHQRTLEHVENYIYLLQLHIIPTKTSTSYHCHCEYVSQLQPHRAARMAVDITSRICRLPPPQLKAHACLTIWQLVATFL